MNAKVTAGAADVAATRIAQAIETHGWAVSDSFVGARDVRTLLAQAQTLVAAGSFHPAAVGHSESFQVNAEIRSDQVLWIDPSTGSAAQRRFAAKMETLRCTLNEKLFLGLVDLDVHFAAYEQGAFYQTHLDRAHGAVHRTLSCVLYLNGRWQPADGGELVLYSGEPDCEPSIRIEPQGGRLVCFLAERFPHEVVPARRARLSIAGWFSGRH